MSIPITHAQIMNRTITIDQIEHRSDKATGCWLWLGKKNDRGYAVIGGYRGLPTLRLGKYILEKKLGRSVADGLETRHTCHNRACVNPDHVVEGSHSENIQDAWDNGRSHKNNYKRTGYRFRIRYEKVKE